MPTQAIKNAIAPLFMTDCYKLGHVQQYAAMGRTTKVYSNYTHRKSRRPGCTAVVHFGLQAALQRYLVDAWTPFFNEPVDMVCEAYEARVQSIVGPNTIGSSHIRALHAVGHLPLKVRALPEGTLVPIGVPSWTVENTDPQFAWLTNYVETILSTSTWLTSTSATTSAHYRTILDRAAQRTGGAQAAVDWQAHDFSMRGMSSFESAQMSGAAHLLAFNGSDSLPAADWIDQYYGGPFVLGSVPASEHSVMSAGIAKHGETETFRRLLELYPTGIVSVVSDTFDLWHVLTKILPALREQILARDGALVIRPDSGSPELILCGDPSAPTGTPAWWGVVRLLHQEFGASRNAAGFFQLDPHVGTIYGDSITLERADAITRNLEAIGYASTNVVFGVGSYTFQMVTRDTFGSAIKATVAEIDGAKVNLRKDPVTDDGTKRSATGYLAVRADPDTNELRLFEDVDHDSTSELRPVWENGAALSTVSFADVRQRLHAQLAQFGNRYFKSPVV